MSREAKIFSRNTFSPAGEIQYILAIIFLSPFGMRSNID